MVGTKAWERASGGRPRRNFRDPDRSDWTWGSNGSVTGQPSLVDPPAFGWQPRRSLAEAHMAGQGSSLTGSRLQSVSSSPSLSESQSDTSMSRPAFPPSPAFIRHYMHTAKKQDEAAAADEDPSPDAGTDSAMLSRRGSLAASDCFARRSSVVDGFARRGSLVGDELARGSYSLLSELDPEEEAKRMALLESQPAVKRQPPVRAPRGRALLAIQRARCANLVQLPPIEDSEAAAPPIGGHSAASRAMPI